MAEKDKSNELSIIRLYDAPLKLVWEAWTDPVHVAQWWGPRGFSLTTHSKDLRTGGSWIYTMHGPDGTDYPNHTHYLEVEEHSKLVYDHGGTADSPPLFRVTVLFSEHGEKTKMDMTMTMKSPEETAAIKDRIKKAGGGATWDRLAEHLARSSMDKELFVINRSFEAPIDLVFDMWTEPGNLERWLPPKGASMKFLRGTIAEGETAHIEMSYGIGGELYARFTYLTIDRPNEIIYSQQFCDENENVSRHPLAPTWPTTMRTAIQFVNENENSTRVTVSSEILGDATHEELETFVQGKSGMTVGWTGSFDALEEILKQAA